MKSAIDKEHLKIHKDQDNNLFLKMCNKGLSVNRQQNLD